MMHPLTLTAVNDATTAAEPLSAPDAAAGENEQRRWSRLLILVAGALLVSILAMFVSGSAWFLLPAGLSGPAASTVVFVYLAISSDTNAAPTQVRDAHDAERFDRLRDTDGFRVQSADDAGIGLIEDVWFGDQGRPRALALRTCGHRRALVLAEDVLAVDRANQQVTVRPQPALLELGAPRIISAEGDSARLAARWATTGAVLEPPPPARLPRDLRHRLRYATHAPADDKPVWFVVGAIFSSVAIVVAFVITLAFTVPWVVTGAPS